MQQRVVRTASAGWRIVPPVIDEKIDRLERVDAVPPVEGNVDCIAGFQFRDLRPLQSLRVPRESLKVRFVGIDQADWRSSRREINRPDIQILELVRRKQNETPSSCNDNSEIFHQVVVWCDL